MAFFRKGSTKSKPERVYCATCGAKNEAGVGRCRVCTCLMPQEVASSGIEVPGVELQPVVEEPVETLVGAGTEVGPISSLAELEHFDPTALQIGEPALPRPSTNDG